MLGCNNKETQICTLAQTHKSFFLRLIIAWGGRSLWVSGYPPSNISGMQVPSILSSNTPSTWPFSASKPAEGETVQRRHACFSKSLVHNWYIALQFTSRWGELGTATYKGFGQVASDWAAASQLLCILEGRTDFGEQLAVCHNSVYSFLYSVTLIYL